VSSDGNRRPLEMFGKLKKISVLTISSSIWRHLQSRGPERASGAGLLLLPPGLGKSHRTLQVPKYPNKFGDYGKILDRCPNISACFSCLHVPPFNPGGGGGA
jgi:hypothetical protein